ncbi:recombination repair protein 1 [Folsomia candida]|uniref:recombination repair protein 1 n=1 Tax=Folsomia candida TaxID=158441 RepID=UPI000B8F9B20|nr:recombination repair protein 1 [Folsomia candida]XP_021956671.1 recombination repair protein 1 [Folsomia candida]
MGRPKRSAAPAADVDTEEMEVDKAAEKARIGREKAKKSYREDSASEDEAVAAAAVIDPKDKDFSDEDVLSPSESEGGSDWAGDSSGSEYGKKSKKTVAKKGRGSVGRGRGRKAASPAKGKGRGRGRPPAASSASKNGKKATPAKRGRGGDSDEESESDAETSGSDYGKKKKPAVSISPKKRGPAAKKSPAAKASPKRKRGAAASSSPSSPPAPRRVGRASASKSYKEMSEDDDIEVSDDDKPVTKKAKLEPKAKPAAKKAEAKKKAASASEDEEDIEDDVDESMEDEEEDEKKADKKVTTAKKNGSSTKKEVEKKDTTTEEEDVEEEEEDDDEGDKKKKDTKVDKKDNVAAAAAKNRNNGHTSPDEEESGDEDDVKFKDDKSPASEENGASVEDDDEDKVDKPALKNKTTTDYSKIDFETDKKTPKGDEWNYKIACWNIGGIKSWLGKNGLEYLVKEDPDILCLNEVRCGEKTKPEQVSKLDKYPHLYWSFNSESPGHSGVAIFSKEEAKSVEYGLPENEADSSSDKKLREGFNKEGRLITVEFDQFYLINAYVPNSGRAEKSDKYPKGYPPKVANGDRLKFDEFFRNYVKELEKKKSVIVTGDLNVAHAEIDLANPKTNDRTAGFTKEERDGMTKLLEETTLFDSFRELYPDAKGKYSFWSYMHNAREKNTGWRLDYFLLSEKLRDSLCDNVMRTEVYGSDHCPIVLFMRN